MTSNINPQNIDGAYPVAGQDNDSQGFRDNFTNTKTNFEYAKEEITDLQDKVVLKAALTGTTLNNDMAGSVLSNAELRDMSETLISLGPLSGTVPPLDYSAGSFFTLTTAGPVSVSFANWPAVGTVGRLRLAITVSDPAHTLTLPVSVSLGTTGIQGWSSNVITFVDTGTFEFEFETSNAGSSITIFDLNRPLVAGYTNQLSVGSTLALPSYEDLADAATANVDVTTSYFTTGGAETASLGSAPIGTIKVLYARDVTAGPMVITASGAAWGGAGTITFTNTGDACTLLSTGGGWVCIGNNGATFA